jgi:small subunit ribosomal protein S6
LWSNRVSPASNEALVNESQIHREEKLRTYELVLVLDPDSNGETDNWRAKIRDIAVSQNGQMGQGENWGKKSFAYEVRHKKEGIYLVERFKAEPSVIDEIDRICRLSDEIIRHKIVKLPDKIAEKYFEKSKEA